jgi:hypothetical protein
MILIIDREGAHSKMALCSRDQSGTSVETAFIRLMRVASPDSVPQKGVRVFATNCDDCIDFAILCTIDRRLREKSMCVVMLITYFHAPDCANCAEMAG